MATLPTIPGFSYQEVPTVTKLNQLAGAVSFVTQMPIVASLKRSSTQSITASTSTAVQWNVSEVDSDGMHSNSTNPSRLTAQTQGYYRVHAVLTLSQTGTAAEYQGWFQQTTGSNNPAGSGHTIVFSGDASLSDATSTDMVSISLRSLTPCLYIGDYIEAYVNTGVSCSLQYNWNNTTHVDAANAADGGSCLYVYYCFEGP